MNNTIGNSVREVLKESDRINELEEVFLRTRESDKQTKQLLALKNISRQESLLILHKNNKTRELINEQIVKAGYDPID